MRNLILIVSLLFSGVSFAGIDTVNHLGKIVRVDQKTMTIEIMGSNYKFYRAKLGKEFASLKKGDSIYIQVDGETAKN